MKHILIVGAGPVGLTCAIELARRQHHVTLIEQKAAREHISKAIGINALSLRLFEAADVTPRLISGASATHDAYALSSQGSCGGF